MSPTVYWSVFALINPPTYSLKCFPTITVQSFYLGYHPGSRIPASLAIAIAVFSLSPVIILTLTPAWLQTLTARAISSLIGSLIPTKAKTVRSLNALS